MHFCVLFSASIRSLLKFLSGLASWDSLGKYVLRNGRQVSTYVHTYARTQDRPKRSVVRTNKYIRALEFLSAFGRQVKRTPERRNVNRGLLVKGPLVHVRQSRLKVARLARLVDLDLNVNRPKQRRSAVKFLSSLAR